MSAAFTLLPVDIRLPRGAFAGGGRDILRHGDRALCGFTRGALRPCLHPVWTPAGHVVTAEQPADHPHHRGIWVACDHVGLMMQGPDGTERHDYCFYVDQVFQGRAPGRICQTGLTLVAQTDRAALVCQDLAWIGPAEWGADDGRRVLDERRWTAFTVTDGSLILDITSEVTPAGDVGVALGPTRHAWFNARLADAIALDPGSAPTDFNGNRGAGAIATSGTALVDFSGPVGGGAEAGITVIPVNPETSAWFIADWGVLSVGHMRSQARHLAPGQRARFCCRMVAHDGGTPRTGAWDDIPFLAPEDMPDPSAGDTP